LVEWAKVVGGSDGRVVPLHAGRWRRLARVWLLDATGRPSRSGLGAAPGEAKVPLWPYLSEIPSRLMFAARIAP
jgi:hypothetical protein